MAQRMELLWRSDSGIRKAFAERDSCSERHFGMFAAKLCRIGFPASFASNHHIYFKEDAGMLDFRIDTFLKVCQYMNYTRAAKDLCISQPAVTQHIQALEKFYDTELFLYEGKRLTRTRAGEELLRVMTVMKNDELSLQKHLQELKRGEKTLDFGVTLTIGEFVMPQYLTNYLHRYPDSKVNMKIANTQELLAELASGVIDFAFVEGFFQKENYDYITVSSEEYVAVASPANVCAKAKKIEWKQVFAQTLISREAGSGSREILERILADRNNSVTDFHNIIEIGNIHSIKTLVMANEGISFMYRRAVETELQKGTLVEIKIEDFAVKHDFTFIWRKGSAFAGEYREIYAHLIGRKRDEK